MAIYSLGINVRALLQPRTNTCKDNALSILEEASPSSLQQGLQAALFRIPRCFQARTQLLKGLQFGSPFQGRCQTSFLKTFNTTIYVSGGSQCCIWCGHYEWYVEVHTVQWIWDSCCANMEGTLAGPKEGQRTSLWRLICYIQSPIGRIHIYNGTTWGLDAETKRWILSHKALTLVFRLNWNTRTTQPEHETGTYKDCSGRCLQSD